MLQSLLIDWLDCGTNRGLERCARAFWTKHSLTKDKTKMNKKTPTRKVLRQYLAAGGLGLLVLPQAWSQEADAESAPVFELSPFEVDSSQDVGYMAQNTLAGSRLNTKIADLASSITVVTLEQMEDTASVDINDVFRYEANTEGAETYTRSVQSLRNDGVVDTNAGFTHGANGQTQAVATNNRVRGIGQPGTTVNYYQSIAEVPFDYYNTGSVEINRGPNSLLFGLGNPAGIVNQNTARAQFGADTTKVQFRVDDRGSFRASLNLNREIIEDKLAVYMAFLNDDRDFERKPSYDNSDRVYAAVTLKPTSKTTLRANIERYENKHRRPNTLTPRDTVTEWRTGGKWGYDPSTGMLKSFVSGEEKGPLAMRASSPRMDETRAWIESMPNFDASLWNSDKTSYNGSRIYGSGALTDPNSVLYTPGLILNNNSRPKFLMYDGQVMDYLYFRADRYRDGYGTAENPAGNAPLVISESEIFAHPASMNAYETGFSSSYFYSSNGNGIGSYRQHGVTDKSIYDWSSVNALAMNFGEKDNTTYNIELEQELLPNLVLSLGHFKQDFSSLTSYTVSQLNATTIYVDTNTHLPDGVANPMFGLPMIIGPTDPDRFQIGTENETSRAMLAWTPDFTGNDGWTKWLGRHQAIGLWSDYNTLGSFWRKRWYITDSDEGSNGSVFLTRNPNPNADGSPTGWKLENRSVQRLWYLANPGDAQDGSVTRAAGAWNNASYEGNMQYFNWSEGGWRDLRYQTGYIDHSAHTGRSERQVESLSFGLTSFLWNDRLVTTVGWREDDYRARATTSGAIVDQDGNQVEPGMTNQEKWVDGYYQTDVVFNRWNRWDEVSGNTSTLGAVLRPFDNWKGIQSEFLRSLGFSYNRSDNFNPPASANVDAFGRELPKPTGEGEDYGIQFSLMDNKLFARVNWFKATNDNERHEPGTTLSRFNNNIDTTLFRNWAYTIAKINMGFDPTSDESWGTPLTPAQETQLEADAEQIWGLPYDYYDDLPGSIKGTRSAEAEGVEVQITYNPTPNWTLKFTAGQQETIYSNVLKEYYEWADYRTPTWDAARGADYLLPQYQQFTSYTTEGGREVNLANFWDSYGYHSSVTLEQPVWTSVRATFDDIVTPQVAIQTDLEGQAAPGQRKNRFSFITNYKFTEGNLEGWNVGGGMRWEDKAIIGYLGRPNPGSGSSDLTLSDTSKPIYDSANARYDFWMGYTTRLERFGVDLRVRLNVVDVFEDGGLQAVAVNYDGQPYAFRIKDPRQFILTVDLMF